MICGRTELSGEIDYRTEDNKEEEVEFGGFISLIQKQQEKIPKDPIVTGLRELRQLDPQARRHKEPGETVLYLSEEGVAQKGAGTWPGEKGEESHITRYPLPNPASHLFFSSPILGS